MTSCRIKLTHIVTNVVAPCNNSRKSTINMVDLQGKSNIYFDIKQNFEWGIMKRERLDNDLITLFKKRRMVALLGPRQCGKTTLAKTFVSQLDPKTPRQNYFDLENPFDLARLTDPYEVLKSLKGMIVIDEIQRMPDIFPVLRVLYDDFYDKSFLLLGSASKQLIQHSSETLTGRIHYKEIFPFGYFETHEREKLWLRGGFPLSYLAIDEEDSMMWRSDYVRTVLEQDVPNLGFKISATHLRRFWMLLANCHGQFFNASQMASTLDLSAQSVKRYLDLLTDMLMVRQLAPWFENIKKRQVKSPKVYIRDSGLLHYLLQIYDVDGLAFHPKMGLSFEGFVIEEIIKTLNLQQDECFFWRTQEGAELDLLVLRKNKKIGFEIKKTSQPKMTRSINTALSDLRLDHLFLVHSGDISWALSDRVTAFAFRDLLGLDASIKSIK
jgi:predicted AAA+ superfamily ATPase